MGENFSDEVQWNQWTTVENIAVLKTKYHIIIFPEQIFKKSRRGRSVTSRFIGPCTGPVPVHKIEKIISAKGSHQTKKAD